MTGTVNAMLRELLKPAVILAWVVCGHVACTQTAVPPDQGASEQGVDLGGQIELFALIEKLRNQRGCGVIMVSHDLHLVMANTDRVVCLNRHICCSGRPELVTQDPAYLSLFGASSSAALAVYHHHHDHEHDLSGACLDDENAEMPQPILDGQNAPSDNPKTEERESA